MSIQAASLKPYHGYEVIHPDGKARRYITPDKEETMRRFAQTRHNCLITYTDKPMTLFEASRWVGTTTATADSAPA